MVTLALLSECVGDFLQLKEAYLGENSVAEIWDFTTKCHAKSYYLTHGYVLSHDCHMMQLASNSISWKL